MKQEIKVPRMGESISEATVSAILKPAGSQVQVDDELLELATDKVNQLIYATAAGRFTPTVKEEDVVKIDQVIGHIDTEAKGEEVKKAEPKATPSAPAQPTPKPVQQEAAKAAPQDKETSPVRQGAQAFLQDLKAPKSTNDKPSSSARDDDSIVIKETPKAVQRSESRETRRKMSRIRKVIATRLVEVQQAAAMLTTFNEVDMSAIMKLRENYKETFVTEHGVRLGFMPFFVKATVAALRRFPDLNSYIDGDEIVHREYYDIGIAVGTDKGLMVPVVRDCDQLSFAQVEKAIVNYAAKLKEGTVTADDLQGAGFTITNGGVYGSLLSTPIISPQQCAILGMHKIEKRAVVVDDEIVIRPMMYLALSYDHRLIDGKEAVAFLVHVKNLLEDPSRILLNL